MFSDNEVIQLLKNHDKCGNNNPGQSLKVQKVKKSAVLVVIHYNHNSIPFILFTKRSSRLKSHSREISFPGGRYELIDGSLVNTAIRETFEEIGLRIDPSEILTSLPPVYTVTSNYLINPYVTVVRNLPQLVISHDEVDDVISLPLIDVLHSMQPDNDHIYLSEKLYKFSYNNYVIWGATAKILIILRNILKIEK